MRVLGSWTRVIPGFFGQFKPLFSRFIHAVLGDLLKRCISCGKMSKDFAEFPDPYGEGKVVRCGYCRENRVKYTAESGFAGP